MGRFFSFPSATKMGPDRMTERGPPPPRRATMRRHTTQPKQESKGLRTCGDPTRNTSSFPKHQKQRHHYDFEYATMLPRYDFYFSFENDICRDYITEKFFLAMNNSVVPVVMGPRREDYEKVAPPHSFIHVEDYSTLDELARHLEYLKANRTAYLEYSWWKDFYASYDWNYIPAPVNPQCQLCRIVNEFEGIEPKKDYRDFARYWIQEGQCQRRQRWQR